MNIINRFLKITSNVGKIVAFTSIIFVISLTIVSIKIKNEKTSNPFCNNKYQDIKLELNYKEIKKYSYKYDCSTLYFNIFLNEKLTKEEIISLIISIGSKLKNYEGFIHFEIFSEYNEKPIYATLDIDEMKVYYVSG